MTRTVDFIFRITRNGADYSRLYPIQGSPPSLYLDANKAIHMALQGNFGDPGPDVDFMTDRIAPVIVIDGVEYPLGQLLPAKVKTVITKTGHYISIQAYDQCWILQTSAIDDRKYYAAGTKYMDIIDELLDEVGIGLSFVVDNNYTVTRIRDDWMPGTNYLSIINELLDEINYSHIWFDLNGYAIIAPDPDLQSSEIRHTLSESDVRSLLTKDAGIDSDYYSTPNVFMCICSNFEQSPMVATAINNDLGSPVSVPRRGRKIYSVSQVKDSPSQEMMQAIVDRALNLSRLRTETISVITGLLPDFGINELVALNIDNEMSVCIERGWTMQMAAGGTMTHRMERVVANFG